MGTNNHWYLHVDLDAFFASVEQLDHPEYKGKPVIVGGKPEDKRSVVSTASYEARKFGVHSAMPTYQAYKLCPQGIYVYGRMKRYSELSYQIMNIFREYSPDVDQMSIDEAFIDITGTEKLFGPPEETALKIKKHVKDSTGLTVSVGLATTKYLAKIASGFSKPDGFYFIHPGTEQEFMLNLPLNKVWGVGTKTLEALKKSGLYTTRDIYEKSFDALEFLFGKNSANFLYNTVRGIDTVNFGHEVKKHSISAETTFIDDIKDKYLAETQLMELCQGVIFRLLKDEGYSRTAFVKIRYDDFSTVSIQKTVDRSILTLDSYFEIIKTIFEEKYEVGRGIRLLGVGFDNIEKEDRPFQQDLFISNNSKKQEVEKAILKLSKKHPEIKIHKARTLNKIKCFFIFAFLSFFSVFSNKISAEPSITKNDGAGTLYSNSIKEPEDSETTNEKIALFNYKLNDKNSVDFLLSGYWIGKMESSFNFLFPDSASPFLSVTMPIFTQEVDLSTWIMINKNWYFEADFADQFEKNTFALGYEGDGYLKSMRLSNRNITMPSDYSAKTFGYALTGGNNQAPGITLHFADIDNSRWYGDFLLRYDMTKSNSATFYGKNSVTDTQLPITDFLYGKTFIFPENSAAELTNIDSIYVENIDGKYKDKNGKKYTKLSATDYSVVLSLSKLTFSQNAHTFKIKEKIPSIIITFTTPSSIAKIINDTGSYSDQNSFAGKIQDYFNTYSSDSSKIDFSKYTYNLETSIDGKSGLLIQNSKMFSPYLCANIYDCGLYSQSDLYIRSVSSEKISTEYYAEELTTDITSLTTDFLQETHLFAQVFSNNSSNKSLQKPENRFPFADTFPEIYLGTSEQEDLELIIRSYSPVSDIQIGTEAIEETVQVYINGILDSSATYNSESGIINTSKSVSNTDKIYITWQEDASNYTNGALSVGSGLFFNITPNLKTDFSITSRWPVYFSEKYSTVDSPLYGFSAITSGISYSKNNFTIQDKAAVSINSDNISGNLLVLQHNNQLSSTSYLSNSDGFITQSEPYLSDFNISCENKNNYTIKKHGGTTDSKITGYKIPLEFDFSSASDYSTAQPAWASVDIHLENGHDLKNSSIMEFAIQPQLSDNVQNNIEIYLQLGINASSNFQGEEANTIPTWKISDSSDTRTIASLDLSSNDWQTIKVSLCDEDRSKLSSDCDARLVIIYAPSPSVNQSEQKGIIYLGPYEPKTQSIFTKHDNSILVDTYSELTTSTPSAKKLSISDNCSSKIRWNNFSQNQIITDSTITAYSYFKNADFSKYKTINYDFATTTVGQVSFLLTDEEDTAVNLTIFDLSPYYSSSNSPEFHTVSINTNKKTVQIDGIFLHPSEYTLEITQKVIPNKAIFVIDTKKDGIFQDGQFYIGNIYYEESEVYFNAQNYVFSEYKKDGTILSTQNYEIAKDPYLKVSSIQSTSTVTADSEFGITITDIRYEADISSDLNAGHKIKTTHNLFNFLNFEESYRFSKNDKKLDKTDKIGITLPNKTIPFSLNFETNGNNNNQNISQTSKISNDISTNILSSTVGLNTNYKVSQKINTGKNILKPFNTDNYFNAWYDISKFEISTGEKDASLRNQQITSSLYFKFFNSTISPELSYGLGTKYQNTSDTTIQDITNIKFIFPFVVKNNNFSFEIGRTGEGIQTVAYGGSYITDTKPICDSYSSKTWIYSSIPFYDLFDNSISSKINKLSADELSNSYEALYKFEWKRKLFNTFTDLLIPSSTSLAFSRNLKSGIEKNDMYQIKCIVSTNALNCFGSDSKLKLASWYKQDEILTNITAVIQLPSDKLTSPIFNLQTYQQCLFYITSNSVLKTGIDFSIESNHDWSTKTTFIWTRPGKTSFIPDFINSVKKSNPIDFDISRNDIFNFSIGKTEHILQQKYEYIHNTDYKFLKYYTLNTGAGIYYSQKQNSSRALGFTISLGIKMVY